MRHVFADLDFLYNTLLALKIDLDQFACNMRRTKKNMTQDNMQTTSIHTTNSWKILFRINWINKAKKRMHVTYCKFKTNSKHEQSFNLFFIFIFQKEKQK